MSKVHIALTETEATLLIEFLDLAENEFASHGCNDFYPARPVPDLDKRRALAKSFHAYNGDPETFKDDEERGETYEWFQDYALMGYLADKVKRQVEKTQGEKS